MHQGGKIAIRSRYDISSLSTLRRGLHARRRRGQPEDQGRSLARPALHVHPPPRGHRHGRHGRPRPGRHRPQGGHAGHGGQGQPARDPDRSLGHAHPARHQGPGRDRRDGRPHRADLRRDPARGHLRAPLLRDRGADPGPARYPRHARRPARHGRRRHGHAPQRGQGDRRGPAAKLHRGHRPRRGRPGPGQDADVPLRQPRPRRRHRPRRPGPAEERRRRPLRSRRRSWPAATSSSPRPGCRG